MAGSPWGLVLTFKSLARSGEKHGEAEGWVSLQGKTQRGSKAGYFSDRLSGSGARRAVPTPRGCGQDPGSRRSPPPPPPPPGKTDPRHRRRRREHWPVPFLSRWTASGCHRGPPATVTEARPTSIQPPPGSASQDPGLTFPGGSALSAHSPQPGAGAARHSVPGAGAGPGAWETLTAASQRSRRSRRRRLPPWLRRRHLTTEVTHRPAAPLPAPSPESGVGAPS